MKQLFDRVSAESSRLVTNTYSTSFSLGIHFLNKDIRQHIYSIYGFVRLADEIVDSFHGYEKRELLKKLRQDTEDAVKMRISLNPILNSFQEVVNKYRIRQEWIEYFLDSMEMDLVKITFNSDKYQRYIMGSAEAVGLMCLHVFVNNNHANFDKLKPYAMKLGAAFQKVNFLRDLKSDSEDLGRVYFPMLDLKQFTPVIKKKIEDEIQNDFMDAITGIRQLPENSRKGVFLAYYYYMVLFKKIRQMPPESILKGRVRIPNFHKLLLLVETNLRYNLNFLRIN